MTKAKLVSNCCGEPDSASGNEYMDGPNYSELELCPQCKERCIFISEEEFENENKD